MKKRDSPFRVLKHSLSLSVLSTFNLLTEQGFLFDTKCSLPVFFLLYLLIPAFFSLLLFLLLLEQYSFLPPSLARNRLFFPLPFCWSYSSSSRFCAMRSPFLVSWSILLPFSLALARSPVSLFCPFILLAG